MTLAKRRLGELQDLGKSKLEEYQLDTLRRLSKRAIQKSEFYRQKFAEVGLEPAAIKSLDDLSKLPFTTKEELRENYPINFRMVPEEDIVRIHSSSGTTGKPVIMPYTQGDIKNWEQMMVRALKMAGVAPQDRVQVTPGYGLWTAGIGFQQGVEELGALAVPTGPGNTEKQLEMMKDMQSSVLIGTSSYALLLAEAAKDVGVLEDINIEIGIFGSERWSEEMRDRIEDMLGLDAYDIYGLTEIYGPGIGIDCEYHQGIHYWADHFIFEIIDPETGERCEPGEIGELVITTLSREAMPLIRYRTRDLTKKIPGECKCGSNWPRIDRIYGRSDDVFKVKGVNVYPGQIEDILEMTSGASSEYKVLLEREKGRDQILFKVEADDGGPTGIENELKANIKKVINIKAEVEVVGLGKLGRSTKKTNRVIDKRCK